MASKIYTLVFLDDDGELTSTTGTLNELTNDMVAAAESPALLFAGDSIPFTVTTPSVSLGDKPAKVRKPRAKRAAKTVESKPAKKVSAMDMDVDTICRFLDKPVTMADLVEEFGDSVKSAMPVLIEAGRVEKIGKARWTKYAAKNGAVPHKPKSESKPEAEA